MTEMPLEKIDDCRWRIPRRGKMRVDGIVFVSDSLMETLRTDEEALQQVVNVATLPGIVGASYAMPDIHWGYGFPIGGVAPFDLEEGVISPGGVGYDINCGVRLLRTDLEKKDLEGKTRGLVEALFRQIPSGVGGHHRHLKFSPTEIRQLLVKGAKWAVEKGYGEAGDLERIESSGVLPGANPDAVSEHAMERGQDQVGTVGSGNHFIEIEYVDEIYDPAVAEVFGLFLNQIVVHIHSGSRGLGYQVCEDYLDLMLKASGKYGIELVDRQLCSAPIASPEGKEYLGAMAAAANFAFANRQLMTHFVRETFQNFLQAGDLGIEIVYDVTHNIAKFEEHEIEGKRKKVCVHRKGATRAFPSGHPELAPRFRKVGQPVLIPGDMGRYSFVLVGKPGAMELSCGSCCHGAGRRMSRIKAKKMARGRKIYQEFEEKGIYLQSATLAGVLEEVPEAYKDVAQVVEVVHNARLAGKVARLRPLGVIKG